MFNRLRIYIYPLLVGLFITSCSSEEPLASGREMKFEMAHDTRAAITSSNITDYSFALFGDMTPFPGSDEVTQKTVLFDNANVSHNGSAWIPSSTQYWMHNHDHSFVAILPSEVISAPEADYSYSDSKLSFAYTLPADHTLTHDILTATHRRKYVDQREIDEEGNVTGTTADVVYLRFSHLLSLINVAPAFSDNIMAPTDFIEFHKVVLSGFKSKAVFSITPSPLQIADETDDRVFDVDGHEGTGEITINFSEPKRIFNDGKFVRLLDDTEAFMMLPQIFAADSDAKIMFTYSLGEDPTEKQATLSLKGQQWLSGKNYVYNFTIDRIGPHFNNATITDWDILNVGDINAH